MMIILFFGLSLGIANSSVDFSESELMSFSETLTASSEETEVSNLQSEPTDAVSVSASFKSDAEESATTVSLKLSFIFQSSFHKTFVESFVVDSSRTSHESASETTTFSFTESARFASSRSFSSSEDFPEDHGAKTTDPVRRKKDSGMKVILGVAVGLGVAIIVGLCVVFLFLGVRREKEDHREDNGRTPM
jgi:hypothetical protein